MFCIVILRCGVGIRVRLGRRQGVNFLEGFYFLLIFVCGILRVRVFLVFVFWVWLVFFGFGFVVLFCFVFIFIACGIVQIFQNVYRNVEGVGEGVGLRGFWGVQVVYRGQSQDCKFQIFGERLFLGDFYLFLFWKGRDGLCFGIVVGKSR